MKKKYSLSAVVLLNLVLLPGVGHAIEITRSGVNADLNLEAAWSGTVVPGSGDVAVWQSDTSDASDSLGADLSWQGMKIIDPGNNISIAGTGLSLTLGSSGIDMSASTANLTFINSGGTVLGADQTWNVGADRLLWARRDVNGTGHLTLTGSGTTFLDSGSNLYSGGTTLDGANVLLGSVAEFGTGTLTIQNDVALSRDDPGTLTIGVRTVFTGSANSLTLGYAAGPSEFAFSEGVDAGTEVRTINLVNANPAATDNLALSFGGTSSSGAGGSLRLINGNASPSTEEVWVIFGIASNLAVFNGNLEIGQNVQAFFRSSDQLGAGTDLTVNGVLDVSFKFEASAINPTIGSLSGTGSILSNKSVVSQNKLTIDGGASTSSTTFSGTISDGISLISIAKSGSTTQILSGDNTYTGTTEINGGTLLINGDQSAATGAVTVEAAGTLGGIGTVGGTTDVNGTLSPGTSPGTLSFSQGLNINDGATYAFEGGDLVAVTGQLDLNDNWTLALGSGMADGGSIVIFSYGTLAGTPDLTPAFNIDNLGFVPTGPLSLIDDSINSQIVLQGVSLVPEPTTAGLIGMGLSVVLFGYRRRRA